MGSGYPSLLARRSRLRAAVIPPSGKNLFHVLIENGAIGRDFRSHLKKTPLADATPVSLVIVLTAQCGSAPRLDYAVRSRCRELMICEIRPQLLIIINKVAIIIIIIIDAEIKVTLSQ